MSEFDTIKRYITIGFLIFFGVLAIFSGGSQLVNNYSRATAESTTTDDDEEETVVITYNDDIVNEITGGYTGAPTLVNGDDKVFYIPAIYCDGSYLRNFRVIGMNLSRMAKKDTSISSTGDGGDISDYNGVVILYGFQTTYKEDYGNYDFDYEPYDYNVEYEVVDSFFDDIVSGGAADATEKYLGDVDSSDLWNSVGDGSTQVTGASDTLSSVIGTDVSFEENKDVVDDSGFRVATVVMEHEIGSSNSTILYCDSDSATVEDLDKGGYNLVTDLTDDCLTVCYNNQMYVYSFDESKATYATDDVYYYKIQDLLESSTFLNSMTEAGYCSVNYTATGTINFNESDKGWANTWMDCVDTKKVKENITDVTYLSGVTTDKVSKSKVDSEFMDMKDYLQNALYTAWNKRYRVWTYSGMMSYKCWITINSYDDYYKFKADKQNNKSWTLSCDFTATIKERSYYLLFYKTFSADISGTIDITIVPEYKLNSDYTYTIDDILMTKYETGSETTTEATTTAASGSKSKSYSIADFLNINKKKTETTSDFKKYSMIMQMMVTPVDSTSDEYEEMTTISDYRQYVKDLNTGNGEDTNPDGVEESALEETTSSSSEGTTAAGEESEDDLKNAVSTKYLTFNINLSQESGSSSVTSSKIQTIENANELRSYITEKEEQFAKDRDASIAAFAYEDKSGPYVVPKDFTIKGIEEFETQFEEIVEKRSEIISLNAELEELETELTTEYDLKAENISEVNSIADGFEGDDAISDKTSTGDYGYYSELEDKLSKTLSNVVVNDDNSITLTRIDAEKINFYLSDTITAAGKFLDKCPESKYVKTKAVTSFYTVIYSGSDYETDLEKAGEAYKKIANINSKVSSELDALNNALKTVTSVTASNISLGSASDYQAITDTYEGLELIYELANNLTSVGQISVLYNTSYRYASGWMTPKSTFVTDYESFKEEFSYAYNYAGNLDVLAAADSNGKSLLSYMFSMSSIASSIYNYENNLIPAKEAEIAAAEEEMKELKNTFDSTVFSLGFYWEGEEITGEFLDKHYTQYKEITDSLDEYLTAYNSLYKVDSYRTNADTIISNIETLNTDYDINRIIDAMNDAVNMASDNSDYSAFTDDVKYLYNNKNSFYKNISAALNSSAGLYDAETDDNSDYSEEEENVNIRLIKDKLSLYYGSFGINSLQRRTHDQIYSECETIYNSLYDSFSKITTKNDDGEEVETCDITVDTVYKYACEYFVENNITVLTYKDDDNSEVSTSIAKSAENSGNTVAEESTTEATTLSEGYIQNLYTVYNSSDAMKAYADNMYEVYKGVSDLAFSLFYNTGVLTEEQLETIENSGSNLNNESSGDNNSAEEAAGIDSQIINRDPDHTSDYNLGYVPAYKICSEMPTLIANAKSYYETREEAAASLRKTIAKNKMTLVLKDDEYYEWLYKEKGEQSEYLYTLYYEAAQYAIGSDERKAVIDKYNAKTDWVIKDDYQVDEDLRSMLKIDTLELTTTYRKVNWNTSLIDTSVVDGMKSIVTDEPYEIYPMKSNFAVVVNYNKGYVVPMGAQADAVVKGVNTKISDDLSGFEMTGEIDNVAYGYDDSSGFDILFFSSSSLGKWFLITFTETSKTDADGNTYISLDEGKVTGYKGTYDTSYEKKSTESSDSSSSTSSYTDSTSEDSHFLEYDHTIITGINQLYSATIENGFIPYKITCVEGGTGTLEPEVTFIESDADSPLTEFEAGSSGVEGSFFNAWNYTYNGNGYVALLGYTKDDMRLETTTEAGSETTTSDIYNVSERATATVKDDESEEAEEGDTEETTEEVEYRKIADSDIYKAHVYVYDFDTKKAETETTTTANEYHYNDGTNMLSDLIAELKGPYGDLVKTPVILLEEARVPLLVLAYAILALIAIRIGVNYATADDEEKQAKAKQQVKWFIIVMVSVHVVIGCMYCTFRQLKAWEENVAVETKTDETYYHDDTTTTTETTTEKTSKN
ncbi:MAG: pilin [Eubacterium sp.]|nr:pilin [Eubacterium sp.]